MRLRAVALASVVTMVLALPSIAAADADATRGAKLAYTCIGCHGIADYKNTYPTYSVPRLGGQSAQYIVIALTGYKNGTRGHGTMHSHAATMSDQDMQDIAAYLAQAATVKHNPDVKLEAAPKPVRELCSSCHGADGVAILPIYPVLAGQHADYIEQALREYKAGTRKDPVMGTFAGQLRDEDIHAVAQYFSQLKPGLGIPKPLH